MEHTRFETLSDAELDLVAGGAGISLTIDGSGIALSGPFGGELKVPNPVALAGKLVGGALEVTGAVLQGAGHALGELGHHIG